jgi:S-methylmethionine-dependent homocysteine/selenocysteine methylase
MGEAVHTDMMAEFLRASGGAVVMDGGLATELEAHGADLKDTLWSAKCLFTCPQLIKKVFSVSLPFDSRLVRILFGVAVNAQCLWI